MDCNVMEMDAAKEIQRQLKSGYALPPLSILAVKLLELASDDNASSDQLVKLIEKDPSLTVRLLNLANSAYLSSGGSVATVSHAVRRLGSNQIKLMVLSISLRDAFPMGQVEQFDYELFWRISLYRGLIAKAFARSSRVTDPEEAFLAAFTMEIGLPVLFDLCMKGHPSQFPLDLGQLGDLLERERSHLGLDHRQVGLIALTYWRFPAQIVACQEPYEETTLVRPAPVLRRVCELARLFSRILLKAPGAFGSFYDKAQSILGISQESIHGIVLETFDEVEAIARGLKLEINKEQDLLRVMEKANRALVNISQRVAQCPMGNPGKVLPAFTSIDHREKAVSDTLQAVAHEIRNPLTAVGGFARRLATALDPESQAGKYAQVILNEARRLEKILSEMPVDSIRNETDPASFPSER